MPVDAKTFRPTAFGRVHRCAGCDFEYIAPRPTPGETAAFYDIGGYYAQGHDATPQVGPPGLNFFDARTLQATATRAGLQVERLFFDEYCRYFADAYIALEQRIFDHLGGAQPATRYSPWRAWSLLLRTFVARARLKHDCVGVVAVQAG